MWLANGVGTVFVVALESKEKVAGSSDDFIIICLNTKFGGDDHS